MKIGDKVQLLKSHNRYEKDIVGKIVFETPSHYYVLWDRYEPYAQFDEDTPPWSGAYRKDNLYKDEWIKIYPEKQQSERLINKKTRWENLL